MFSSLQPLNHMRKTWIYLMSPLFTEINMPVFTKCLAQIKMPMKEYIFFLLVGKVVIYSLNIRE